MRDLWTKAAAVRRKGVFSKMFVLKSIGSKFVQLSLHANRRIWHIERVIWVLLLDILRQKLYIRIRRILKRSEMNTECI